MPYFTDHELLQRFELYVMQVEELLLAGEDFATIGADLPCAAHLNDPLTLEVHCTNTTHEDLIGLHLDEVRELGMTFLEKHIHPESLKNISRNLPPLYSGGRNSFAFVQYVRLHREADFVPVVTFTKPTKLPNGLVVCLSPRPADFGSLAGKMERIIEIDQFKLQNIALYKQLTARELEVISLLCKGLSNKQIADLLFISRLTVETHRKNIKTKLGFRNVNELMRFAIAFDLVSI